ncbi:MAG: hypothetical protein H3Z50_08275, partial [archaeon]|nr:hypothetical protein [archaeon]
MLNNVKLKKALRPRPMQARLANGRFAPKSVKVVAKAVKEETTKKSEPKLVPDLITEQPKIKKATRNSLTEISQRYASQMNLLIRNEDGFEELHQPFRCRDYFSELIAFQQLPTSITKNWSKAQYGFRYQIKHRLSPDTEYFLQVITKSPFCMDYLNGTLPEEFRSTLIGEWEQDRCRVTLITFPWAYFMNSYTMHY